MGVDHGLTFYNRFFYYCFFIHNNFSSFAFTFYNINRNTSIDRGIMERKILEHITKTIGDIEPKKWESILELYGPLSYKEYDQIIEFIKNKKN